nr:MAG TPA: hypothetical protein [Caudoviricetes sp.]DAU85063.1 MAG TPA: hypothetical protein [Bacteriophage sp.]
MKGKHWQLKGHADHLSGKIPRVIRWQFLLHRGD